MTSIKSYAAGAVIGIVAFLTMLTLSEFAAAVYGGSPTVAAAAGIILTGVLWNVERRYRETHG
jgi:hypothetical protein